MSMAWALGREKPFFEINTYTSFERGFIKNNYKDYRLSAVESTPRTVLSCEVDNVFNECKNDGWADDIKEKSKGIIDSSYLDIKEFVCYLKNFNILPNVVPYKNGCLGLEWNYKDKTIVMMFIGNSKYVYSIITDELNEYGENNQTEENQLNFIKRVYGLLKSA